ncbi:MAG: 16S rRNA (cytidine(1402)-2'-O)-methyltransferase [Spirochaetes bacterium]|nr:16S rRNA (cytidine(1402)-2'-O)-methyltransferase [Spirochaetota bacterium]
MNTGILYSVALPIGNSGDITARAKEILSSVDYIACEDTRKTLDLFRRAAIESKAKLLVHNPFSEAKSAEGLIRLLQDGKSVALVSDAGTPRLSDPGSRILRLCYAARVRIVPIPGPAALTALISVTPFSVDPLVFLGFLSPKSARRQNELKKYAAFGGAIALYESVHRIEKCLVDIAMIFPKAEILIGREMTKTHEEFFLGCVEDAVIWAKGKHGEFAMVFHNV